METIDTNNNNRENMIRYMNEKHDGIYFFDV